MEFERKTLYHIMNILFKTRKQFTFEYIQVVDSFKTSKFKVSLHDVE